MANKQLNEYVLVFSVDLLNKKGTFQGLNYSPHIYLDSILMNDNHKYMRRKEAEKNPNYKQLIPYVIIENNNTILSYQRGVLLSEERLLHNHSIGVGGHISIDDPNLFSTSYEEGMYREINEELHIDTDYQEKIVALLNDDSNEVGKVHIGVIHILRINEQKIRKKEKSINNPHFVSIQSLKTNIGKYENWSRICIENIEKLLSL